MLGYCLLALGILSPGWIASFPSAAQQRDSLPEILPNDNRTPAGHLKDGVLSLALEARLGVWYPEEKDGPGHVVQAFAEEGGPPRIPGPLIRVPEGTEIRVTLRNTMQKPLVLYGFSSRPGGPSDTIHVPPGGARRLRFRTGPAGTYYYGGSTSGLALNDRYADDAPLAGAFIVDSSATPAPKDRVFVIGVWFDPKFAKGPRPAGTRRAIVVNGLSWPHTERFAFAVGDTVRWRWINPSDRVHPMHMHGFYFHVQSRGTLNSDTVFSPGLAPQVVTENMPRGGTMSLLWVPERPGHWMFHCHTLGHISPGLRLGKKQASGGQRHHGENHTMDAMSGLAVGIDVLPSAQYQPPKAAVARRKLRLVAQADSGRYGANPGFGFALEGQGISEPFAIPGPPIVLTRGQPVEITIVNHLTDPTSVHWHGIELESYFDGMSGWSGDQNRLAPQVAPNDSFVVQFTPPRAGTFIYHTHFDEARQLGSGMYGGLLVLEPGRTFDPASDRLLIFSRAGPTLDAPAVLNGSRAPVLELKAGTKYRLRLINISPGGALTVLLRNSSSPVGWRALAKDGADLPTPLATRRPARQIIGVGETYDFELTPKRAGDLQLTAEDRGKVLLSAAVRVR